ncbi:MAG: hypothetical protein QM791_18855 [Ferruginibacter sp.]
MFKLWSEINLDAKNLLKPNLGFRDWSIISTEEKELMWKHLEFYFFIPTEKMRWVDSFSGMEENYYEFIGQNEAEKQKRIYRTIASMSYYYKAKNYAAHFIQENTFFNACKDFLKIFKSDDGNAILEMLSFYCKILLQERENKFYDYQENLRSKNEYEKQKQEWETLPFNEFKDALNDVFADFGVYVYLTSNGFIPRQDEKIVKGIFEPVLASLVDPKWIEVNKLLTDAFKKFRENNPASYSTCVTHTVAAIQAYLQILVNGKIGKGEISKLITQAQKEKIIPEDMFTKEIFGTIESVLMRERQKTGDPHPKEEYATEKNAKLVLNLAMIFLQHCQMR